MHLQLDLPMPPSVNHYWGVRGKQRFIGKQGKQFRIDVAEAVAEAGIKLEGRLAIHIALFPADRRRFDIDNRIKPLLDALQNAGCFEDDEQVDELHVTRQGTCPGGRCTLVILSL